ncbi:hypothetical protein [Streptomyces sp. NPDC048508]|uniref:hypothetical protein n=1 Tax=Streptomyces sp. NPDC048508 TaxID=3365561 RepID=UPI00371E4B95
MSDNVSRPQQPPTGLPRPARRPPRGGGTIAEPESRCPVNNDHASSDPTSPTGSAHDAGADGPDVTNTPAAPVVVGRPAGNGGRRVTIRARSAGLAHSDADLVEFLRRAGLSDAEDLLDDPAWVHWQEGPPHTYGPN